MELAQSGEALPVFLVMSNELSTPKILLCPQDLEKDFATNFFTGFSARNVSYFAGLDATNDSEADVPKLILSGDCNFEIGGKPVKSGLLSLWTNDPVTWGANRHASAGNLCFADGSVQPATTPGLQNYILQTGLATNRLAIP